MGDIERPFAMPPAFEAGERSGAVRLGKFEAHYEEIFADVLEDGVITPEERTRLDRAADSLGLDRQRLQRVEGALQSAYESRHRVRVRDLSELEPQSLAPLEGATIPTTPHPQALHQQIAMLQAKVAELEAELRVARAQAPLDVEVDLGPTISDGADDAEALVRRLRHDPRDGALLHALYAAVAQLGDVDRMFCVSQVLVFLGLATDAEKTAYARGNTEGLLRPTRALTQEGWRRLLTHPEEEVLVGEILAIIAPAVLLGRVSALRRDKALPKLEPGALQDPAQSTLQAVRCVAWAAALLGTNAPPLYADPEFEGAIDLVPGVPPATRLGRKALSGRSATELAFLAGRHLAWQREERVVRVLVPELADLEDLFLAALHIGNPGLPLRAEVKLRVAPLAGAIEPLLEAQQQDLLRACFLRFVDDGGRTNLRRWAVAADRTACRAGLLLSEDLVAAQTMLAGDDPETARDRLDDLLVFCVSERMTSLRKQLGVAVHP